MLFASLHSSKRKFPTVQYVNKEKFFSPYLHSLFVIRSSALATRTLFSSSFLYLPVRLAPSFLRLLFVLSSSFVRHLFVICSSFVRLLFVICSSLRRFSSPFGGSQRKLGMCKGEVSFVFSLSARAARTVFCFP